MEIESPAAPVIVQPSANISLRSPSAASVSTAGAASAASSSPILELSANETIRLKLRLYGRSIGQFTHRLAFICTNYQPRKRWDLEIKGSVDAIQLSMGLEERIRREQLHGAKMVELMEESRDDEDKEQNQRGFSMIRAGLGVQLTEIRDRKGVEWHLRELTKLRGMNSIPPVSVRQELAIPEPFYAIDPLQSLLALPPPLAPTVLSQFKRWYHARQPLALSGANQSQDKIKQEWVKFQSMLE